MISKPQVSSLFSPFRRPLFSLQLLAGMEYYQVELFGDSLLSMDLSSSGEGLCFGDGGGHLHLWAGSEKPQVNRFSKMTAWPKVPSLHRPPRLLDDEEPLSCVPFQGLFFFLFLLFFFFFFFFFLTCLCLYFVWFQRVDSLFFPLGRRTKQW